MDNKPIITNRDSKLSASVFQKTAVDKNGNPQTYYSVCVQRSWKKEGSDDYEREQINLFPDDLLRFANLFTRTYADILLHVQSQPREQKEFPAQTMDDGIPF